MKQAIPIMVIIAIFLTVTFYTINKDTVSKGEVSTPLTELSTAQFQQFIDDEGTGLVYIGRPSCPTCQEFQPSYEGVLKEKQLVSYYYETDRARAENEAKMVELLDSLEVDSVPMILYVEDGVERSRLQGGVSEDEIKTWLKENELISE